MNKGRRRSRTKYSGSATPTSSDSTTTERTTTSTSDWLIGPNFQEYQSTAVWRQLFPWHFESNNEGVATQLLVARKDEEKDFLKEYKRLDETPRDLWSHLMNLMVSNLSYYFRPPSVAPQQDRALRLGSLDAVASRVVAASVGAEGGAGILSPVGGRSGSGGLVVDDLNDGLTSGGALSGSLARGGVSGMMTRSCSQLSLCGFALKNCEEMLSPEPASLSPTPSPLLRSRETEAAESVGLSPGSAPQEQPGFGTRAADNTPPLQHPSALHHSASNLRASSTTTDGSGSAQSILYNSMFSFGERSPEHVSPGASRTGLVVGPPLPSNFYDIAGTPTYSFGMNAAGGAVSPAVSPRSYNEEALSQQPLPFGPPEPAETHDAFPRARVDQKFGDLPAEEHLSLMSTPGGVQHHSTERGRDHLLLQVPTNPIPPGNDHVSPMAEIAQQHSAPHEQPAPMEAREQGRSMGTSAVGGADVPGRQTNKEATSSPSAPSKTRKKKSSSTSKSPADQHRSNLLPLQVDLFYESLGNDASQFFRTASGNGWYAALPTAGDGSKNLYCMRALDKMIGARNTWSSHDLAREGSTIRVVSQKGRHPPSASEQEDPPESVVEHFLPHCIDFRDERYNGYHWLGRQWTRKLWGKRRWRKSGSTSESSCKCGTASGRTRSRDVLTASPHEDVYLRDQAVEDAPLLYYSRERFKKRAAARAQRRHEQEQEHNGANSAKNEESVVPPQDHADTLIHQEQLEHWRSLGELVNPVLGEKAVAAFRIQKMKFFLLKPIVFKRFLLRQLDLRLLDGPSGGSQILQSTYNRFFQTGGDAIHSLDIPQWAMPMKTLEALYRLLFSNKERMEFPGLYVDRAGAPVGGTSTQSIFIIIGRSISIDTTAPPPFFYPSSHITAKYNNILYLSFLFLGMLEMIPTSPPDDADKAKACLRVSCLGVGIMSISGCVGIMSIIRMISFPPSGIDRHSPFRAVRS